MSKPIAYYLSNAEDTETIDVIGTTYGDRLEQLDRSQKIVLLMLIMNEMQQRPLLEPGFLSLHLIGLLKSLSTDTLLGLTSATAHYLREPNHE